MYEYWWAFLSESKRRYLILDSLFWWANQIVTSHQNFKLLLKWFWHLNASQQFCPRACLKGYSFCQGLTDFQPVDECHNKLLYWYIFYIPSKWNSSVLRNWQPIKLQVNKICINACINICCGENSTFYEFHRCKHIWTKKMLFYLLNFIYKTL